jgi:hypothetical protein
MKACALIVLILASVHAAKTTHETEAVEAEPVSSGVEWQGVYDSTLNLNIALGSTDIGTEFPLSA